MPGPTGILDHLPTEKQEQLIDWIESLTAKEVLEKVAAPEPEGFGIKTHATSLQRFYERWQRHQHSSDNESASLHVKPFVPSLGPGAPICLSIKLQSGWLSSKNIRFGKQNWN
jgi:hypothetical protein